MNCDDVREQLLAYQRARLPRGTRDEVHAHLATCAECARAEAAEHELTSILAERLPQHPASLALKRRLAGEWAVPAVRRPWWRRWQPALVPAVAVSALILVAAPLLYHERIVSPAVSQRAGMVAEAVNDHLRVLAAQHPLDIESSDVHQVKPWFAGRLDFAPAVAFEGDAEFPLKGGAVGYFLDRKAAVFVYARRLHPISLVVFRAGGLAWPARDGAYTTAERGFNVILWRSGELGYALVSDVDARELTQLAGKIATRTTP